MKKFTIAAILAVASVAASAQVTLTGKYSMWGDSTKTGSARTGTMVTDPTSNIAIGVKDIYKICEDIRAAGGVITREAGPVKGGNTLIAFIQDPDGYKIELIQR